VQNQHLAVLAKTLKLDQFMLYAHGSDLCHDLELRHAMANCFEALMGALFLDGGIDVVDRVFSETLFKIHPDLLQVWMNLPPHPLQEQEPTGDRQWIPKFELLQNLTKFEESVGLEFNHIRLLARAFTDRSVGYTNLTLGSNQRLEFLGDTVLQLIASEYLYKYFPEHHEGHLSLLRSSLVNNRTQAVVCDDLGMSNYAVYNNPKAELKTKDRADLLEAFIGALYVDQGLQFCEVFCQVTLFPRLQDFIMNQDWNDPKSKLQQCCLTLRTMDGGEPDIPVYKFGNPTGADFT
jgi:ribonuclease-3